MGGRGRHYKRGIHLKNLLNKQFNLEGSGTNIKTEVIAGVISFLTLVYILSVNSTILHDAGIPFQGAMIATILSAFLGSVMIGLWSNSPLVLVPGMGINALFTYTMVGEMGMSWQEALAVVFISGVILSILSFTNLVKKLTTAIPLSLKSAITVGIGFFLTFIGLQEGGIVVKNEDTFVSIANFSNPDVLATVITLGIAIYLFIKNVPANFLITVILGTFISFLLHGGIEKAHETTAITFESANQVVGQLTFTHIMSFSFWIAVFSLTMVILFESIGIIHGQLSMMNQESKQQKVVQGTALGILLSGIFGTSPTVVAVEGSAGISSGGRTGLTSVVTGLLFLGCLLFMPLIAYIPTSAIAPILIIIGSLMVKHITDIQLDDPTEAIPAFLILAFIPLTYSIIDGIAFGFIAYPLVKLAAGKKTEITPYMVAISALFFVRFALNFIS